MKRTTLAIALAGMAGYASAQSGVTLYGVADVMMSSGSGSLSNMTTMGSGGNMTSRYGFRGVEDIGGGLRVGFNLEAQVFMDSGTGQPSNTNNQPSGAGATTATAFSFARRSTVSVMDAWGEVRMGRDFTAHYRNRVEVDPFGNAGVGAAQPFAGSIGGVVSTRASKMIGYFLPSSATGLYGQVQYYSGGNPDGTETSKDGNGLTARVGYVMGGLNLSLASGRTTYATTATAGDIASTNLGVQYQLGNHKIMAGLYRDSLNKAVQMKADGWLLGGIFNVGPGDLKVALSEYGTDAAGSPNVKKLAIGYVHNLSKRTALYGTWARVSNSGGASTALNGAKTAANTSSSGFDIGVRHQF
ncbi:porin [Hydrogenophaga sp. OTU3427]|uniref:porin n=1 Tax=Hydrogenophaga sp. OTU3427 TaxID=3043856 RepID=UPI00313B4D09